MSKPSCKIYLIGICGVAMGTLAGMLKSKGFEVSGSDSNVYPPMSDKLKEWGIDVHDGYGSLNVQKADLVIVGNVISRGNPEAEYVLNNRIPYLSMAQALYNFFLNSKEIIAISGTHGKTTTTAILSHILLTANEDPSFLIGGVSNNYNSNYRLGNGKYFIIEGDEYDSAFFEKIPKFILYRPRHLILTSLEFDHADIYSDIEEIKVWFRRLINNIPSEGNIIFSNEYPHLKNVLKKSLSTNISYARNDKSNIDESEVTYELLKYSDSFAEVLINIRKFGDFKIKTKLLGDFNFANIAAAISMAINLGIKINDIQNAIETFNGVKRRQELIFENANLKIYEDFAHHPTAIKFFLDELKVRYPDSNIWAIYEPRSATSRRNIFQDELPESFNSANVTLIRKPNNLGSISESERLNIESVLKTMTKNGRNAELFLNIDDILNYLFNKISLNEKNIIAIMSNGSFDGIYGKIVEKAKELYGANRDC